MKNTLGRNKTHFLKIAKGIRSVCIGCIFLTLLIPQIYSLDFNDNPGQEMGTIDYGLSDPALSPDGRHLAFVLRSSIWTVPVSGGEATCVGNTKGRKFSPAWSPDGKKIACIETDDEVRSFSIQIYSLDSKEDWQELWRTEKEIHSVLDWSPDGNKFVFPLASDNRICILSIKERKTKLLKFSGMYPRWSPDGACLAFQKADNLDLWISSIKDWKARRLATNVRVNSGFCWSPDSRELVYESLDRESVDLWKVLTSGGKATPLTDDIALEQGPCWHPSNGYIYFSHRRRIWKVHNTGGSMERVPIQCRVKETQPSPKLLAFTGAEVIDMKSGKLIPSQTILVRGSKIVDIGSKLFLPSEAEEIEVDGLVAVPGLMDMHVHYEPWMGPYFLRYGVTRILEMGCSRGLDYIFSIADEIKSRKSSGPLLYMCGVIFNGSGIPGPPGLGGIQSNNPQVIRKAVEWHLEEGVDVVKVGSENTRETLKVVIDLAHSKNRRIYGHISLVPVDEAIDMGHDVIEHPRGLGWGLLPPEHRPDPVPRQLKGMLREAVAWWNPDPKRVSTLVNQMIEKEVIWDPTLYIWVLSSTLEGLIPEPEYEGLPEWIKANMAEGSRHGFKSTWNESDYEAYGAGIPSMRKMVGEFYSKGGLVTAGSDGGIPGVSLHRELEQLLLSGLAPIDCLRAATLNGAVSLQKESEIGSLEKGKAADIVFIQGNPLKDIKVLRNVFMTVQQGQVVYKKEK